MPNKQDPIDYLIGKKHFILTGIILATTLSVLAVLGTIGYLLDKQFQTKPILLVISLILSFPVIQFIIIKKIRNLTKNK